MAKKSINDNGWWYRPEVLDDDLASLKENPEFLTLKSVSDARYMNAVRSSKPEFSWKERTADNLFSAVHGNTQS